MPQILNFFGGLEFSIGTVFWACLIIGAALVLISALFGEILDIAFDADGPLSGPVIAIFLVLFGGAGLLFHDIMHKSAVASSLAAAVVSLAGSSIFYFVFIRFFMSQEGGTVYDPHASVGTMAEVITGIPAEGTGEITFETSSGRMSGPARSIDGNEIARSTVVVIDKVVGNTFLVKNQTENAEASQDN